MSEIRHCPGCDTPRYQHGQGAHIGTNRAECVSPGPGETVMRFWKGNKADASFDWPVGAVADAFMLDYRQRTRAGDLTTDQWPVERQLRDFLTDPSRFNAVWEDEEAFAVVLEIARAQVYAQDGISDHTP